MHQRAANDTRIALPQKSIKSNMAIEIASLVGHTHDATKQKNES